MEPLSCSAIEKIHSKMALDLGMWKSEVITCASWQQSELTTEQSLRVEHFQLASALVPTRVTRTRESDGVARVRTAMFCHLRGKACTVKV